MSIQSQGVIRRTGLIRRLEMCIADLEEENQILKKSLEESEQLHRTREEKLKAASISLFETAQNLYVVLGAEEYKGDTPLQRAWVALGDVLEEVKSIGEEK